MCVYYHFCHFLLMYHSRTTSYLQASSSPASERSASQSARICANSLSMNFLRQHTRRKNIVVNNKLDLILRIIYSSAVWFLKYLKQINNDVATAEKELEKSIRNEDLLQLMKLQKTLVYFNTSIRGNEVMIGRLNVLIEN